MTTMGGYKDMKMDRQKELVTVIGAMDMKALAEGLKKHLKRNVEILQLPKATEKKENGGGEKVKKSGSRNGKSGGGEGEETAGSNVEAKRVQIGAVHRTRTQF